MRQQLSHLPVRRDREGAALPSGVSSVPIHKGVVPIHGSRDSSICCPSTKPADKRHLAVVPGSRRDSPRLRLRSKADVAGNGDRVGRRNRRKRRKRRNRRVGREAEAAVDFRSERNKPAGDRELYVTSAGLCRQVQGFQPRRQEKWLSRWILDRSFRPPNPETKRRLLPVCGPRPDPRVILTCRYNGFSS